MALNGTRDTNLGCEHRFYNVTWPSDSPMQSICVTFPTYSKLKGRFPGLQDELTLGAGESRAVPLCKHGVASLRELGCQVGLRGDGGPCNETERRLLAALCEREGEVQAVRKEFDRLLAPHGDHAQAELVHRLHRFAQLQPRDMDNLRDLGLASEDVCEYLNTIATNTRALRKKLEAKGWRFGANGKPLEPSTGGRRPRHTSSLIWAAYRRAEVRFGQRGAGKEVLTRIQAGIAPVVGEVPSEKIKEVLKGQLRKRRA